MGDSFADLVELVLAELAPQVLALSIGSAAIQTDEIQSLCGDHGDHIAFRPYDLRGLVREGVLEQLVVMQFQLRRSGCAERNDCHESRVGLVRCKHDDGSALDHLRRLKAAKVAEHDLARARLIGDWHIDPVYRVHEGRQ